MNRREVLLLLGGMMTAAPAVRAQQKTMPVIGILASLSPEAPHWVAFFDGLSRLGFELDRGCGRCRGQQARHAEVPARHPGRRTARDADA